MLYALCSMLYTLYMLSRVSFSVTKHSDKRNNNNNNTNNNNKSSHLLVFFSIEGKKEAQTKLNGYDSREGFQENFFAIGKIFKQNVVACSLCSLSHSLSRRDSLKSKGK